MLSASLVIVWSSYSSPSSFVLAFILFTIGTTIVLLGSRMIKDIELPKMGKVLGAVMIAIWAFSILALLRINADLAKINPAGASLGSIFPITITAAFCTAGYAIYICRNNGVKSALGNGFLAFIAGPMAFEFPFVLIVIPRVSVPLVPELIFFTTLFATIITTLSLLLLSRRIAVTRNSVYFYGVMILVFAVWAALDGYSYPTNPLAFALNAISKILGFASVAALFKAAPTKKRLKQSNHFFAQPAPSHSRGSRSSELNSHRKTFSNPSQFRNLTRSSCLVDSVLAC